MNLIIDIGNTRTKVAVFDGDTLMEQWVYERITPECISSITKMYSISKAIVSSVGKDVDCKNLLSGIPRYFDLSSQLKLPITNMYKTPNTLGADRLAGAVGATVLFPDENNLVIDMGTCITLDFVNKDGEYKGGAILPGISMKFKALHTFTNKLPLLSTENLVDTGDIIGNDTQSSIILGVINATCYEMEGFVDRYTDTFGPINIIFTGGDAIYFEKRVKFPNFVNSNLLLIGLNKILNYNE